MSDRTSSADEDGLVLRLNIQDGGRRPYLTPDVVERCLDALEKEPAARVVVLESRGRAFCLGQDPIGLALAADEEASPIAFLERFALLLQAIESDPRPVIALVNGRAAGGGVGLAAAADLVVATHRATFVLPETLLGVIPAVVFPVLARRVGHSRARWLALGSHALDAAGAYRCGLVDELVEDPDRAVARHVRRLSRMDRRAIASVKRLAARHQRASLAELNEAIGTFRQLLTSEETRERLRQFAAGFAPWPDEDPQ